MLATLFNIHFFNGLNQDEAHTLEWVSLQGVGHKLILSNKRMSVEKRVSLSFLLWLNKVSLLTTIL